MSIYLLSNCPEYTSITTNNYYTWYNKTSDEKSGFRRTTPFINSYRARSELWIMFKFTLNT